jgi:nicotinamidase-related amidase
MLSVKVGKIRDPMKNNFKPTVSDAALLIVDAQERLARVMADRERVERNLVILVRLAKVLGVPVAVTQQYTKGLGATVDSVARELTHTEPMEKIHFSCCGEPGFSAYLRSLRRNTVILAGMETHVCVLQTALDLLEQGYVVHVPSDAVCSRDVRNHDLGIRYMERAGAIATSTETVAFQFLGRAGTPEFKEISALLK